MDGYVVPAIVIAEIGLIRTELNTLLFALFYLQLKTMNCNLKGTIKGPILVSYSQKLGVFLNFPK